MLDNYLVIFSPNKVNLSLKIARAKPVMTIGTFVVISSTLFAININGGKIGYISSAN